MIGRDNIQQAANVITSLTDVKNELTSDSMVQYFLT